jgi:hypothetical protein
MFKGDSFGLSSDGRFFSFRWFADEAGGFILVDRAGRGQHIDTGDRPVFSPTHQKFAAIEISESGRHAPRQTAIGSDRVQLVECRSQQVL